MQVDGIIILISFEGLAALPTQQKL